jgi:hypothetical protein
MSKSSLLSWKTGINFIIYTPYWFHYVVVEVRMERSDYLLGRRKFLKKSMVSGAVIAAFPLWESMLLPDVEPGAISVKKDYAKDESHRRILKIVQKYGGEFGGIKGG